MSTIAGTDIFLIARGTTNYKVTAADVSTYSILAGLPAQAGNSGKVLSTNGSGVLSWVAVGGTGTVTSIDVSGGTTGLTYSGGPITASGTITMAGTLALANGGTGGTTQAAAQANLLPNQSGNAGKFLQTDGAGVISWATAGGGAGVTTFSAGTTGFSPAGPTGGAVTLAGTLAVTNGGTGGATVAAAQANLLPAQTAGDAGKFLKTDGAGVISWDTAGGGGVTQITAGTGITVSPAGGTGNVTVNLASAVTPGAVGSAVLGNTAPAGLGLYPPGNWAGIQAANTSANYGVSYGGTWYFPAPVESNPPDTLQFTTATRIA